MSTRTRPVLKSSKACSRSHCSLREKDKSKYALHKSVVSTFYYTTGKTDFDIYMSAVEKVKALIFGTS
jgi:hypothetical protein